MKRILALSFAMALAIFSCKTDKNPETTENKQVTDTITAKSLQEWKSDHFGMFIHFGVYSKLGGMWKGEKVPYYGEQIMNHARITVPEYEAVAKGFNPTDFNADEIVELAENAGMKYIVITTKHHDGFCMFDTQTTDYDIVDFTPYGKDVVGQLADACHRHGMKLGFYYSLPDWHYPSSIPHLEPDSTTKCWEHVNQVYSPLETITPELEEYIVKQISELLTNYGEVTTLWFDMGLVTPEQSKRFRKVVKSIQPQCLINGRIMNNQGDYMTLPDNGDVASYGEIYWDNPASLYGTWGYKSWIERPELPEQIKTQIGRLKSTVSHGGVFLLNIGPDGSGKVIDYEKDVLNGIGEYLNNNPDFYEKECAISSNSEKIITADDSADEIVLSGGDALRHAMIDGTGYMSVQPDSWLSWKVEAAESAEYDIFAVYLPENDAKEYVLRCNGNRLNHVLPGVDRMVQTSYFGSVLINKGVNEIILDQASRCNPLEPLGVEVEKIILRKN